MGIFRPFNPQIGEFGWEGPDSTRDSDFGMLQKLIDVTVRLKSIGTSLKNPRTIRPTWTN